jgi:hypothetical protein
MEVSKWFETGSVMWDFVVDKVALGLIFSEYFGFPWQISFHQLLQKSSSSIIGVCTIGQSGRSTRNLDRYLGTWTDNLGTQYRPTNNKKK